MVQPQFPNSLSDASDDKEEADNDNLTRVLAQMDKQGQDPLTHKVSELIDKNPEQSASVVKSWLSSGENTE